MLQRSDDFDFLDQLANRRGTAPERALDLLGELMSSYRSSQAYELNLLRLPEQADGLGPAQHALADFAKVPGESGRGSWTVPAG